MPSPPPAESSSPSIGAGASNSYGQILKSSSIIGGSVAVNLLIGMAGAKAGAIFLGPDGVGLVKLYQSVITVLRTLSGLGIGSSGVREIAEAVGTDDRELIGRNIRILRKACLVTGILGCALAAALCVPLSQWIFDSPAYAGGIAILGVTIFFSAISGGQTALLQGMRRIADLARINIASGAVTVLVAVPLYWKFGVAGIVPSLLVSAGLTLGISWFYAKKVVLPDSKPVKWGEAVRESKRLVGLGMALMWGGLMSTIVATATGALIVRFEGMAANGFYGAAWSLSGLFAGFILGAMGADFYPRLTAVNNEHPQICRLVNEQTEVGILLSLPGILGTLFFAPLAIKIFYSHEFLASAELLPWFVVGVFGRVTSWPMGFILLAKGASRSFAATETIFNTVHLLLIAAGLHFFGLQGVGYAFFVLYVAYNVVIYAIVRKLVGFYWTKPVIRLVVFSSVLILLGFSARFVLSDTAANILGIFLTIGAGLLCLRGLALRLGSGHRLIALTMCVPGMKSLFTGKKLF